MGTHASGKLPAVALSKLKDGWHGDGGGLYLFVRGASRAWVFRYTGPDGRRRHMGLGSLQAVSLADARKLALEARQQIRHPVMPVDPLEVRRQRSLERRLTAARQITFKQCVEGCLEARKHEWKNVKHAAQWLSTLATYAYPYIGDLPVASIDTDLILKCLRPIWTTKTETASRLRGRIESVLAWATTSKYRQGDNPARWKGHLDTLLARPSRVAQVAHHNALSYRDIASFMEGIRGREGMGARAVEFLILTAARSGEVRGATWSEIDLQNKEWTIPANRMKAGKEHRIPLSDKAIGVLKSLHTIDNCDLVFWGAKAGKPLSDMTLTQVLRRIGHAEITVHGFRSTFRDWAGETTAFPREVIEHALAHQLKDKTEAAYARGTLLKKRRALMDAWAEYCKSETQNDSNVVNIGAGRI